MADWYIRIAGNQFGPLSDRKLAEFVKTGRLTRFHLIRKDISTNWQPAGQIPGLFPSAEKLPAQITSSPPLPRPGIPVSEPSRRSSENVASASAAKARLTILISSLGTAIALVLMGLIWHAFHPDSPTAVASPSYSTSDQNATEELAELRREVTQLKETVVEGQTRPSTKSSTPTPPQSLHKRVVTSQEPSIPAYVPTNGASQADGLLRPEELFSRASPAVVQIEVMAKDGKPVCQGSGFFVDNVGTLVTNSHVAIAKGASFAVVRLLDDTTYSVDDV